MKPETFINYVLRRKYIAGWRRTSSTKYRTRRRWTAWIPKLAGNLAITQPISWKLEQMPYDLGEVPKLWSKTVSITSAN